MASAVAEGLEVEEDVDVEATEVDTVAILHIEERKINGLGWAHYPKRYVCLKVIKCDFDKQVKQCCYCYNT